MSSLKRAQELLDKTVDLMDAINAGDSTLVNEITDECRGLLDSIEENN